MGDIKTLGEIKESMKNSAFPEFVGGGISRSGPLGDMAGEWIFKNAKDERFWFVVRGKCATCDENLERWDNWYMAKEECQDLQASCKAGHLSNHDAEPDTQRYEILWKGPVTLPFFDQMEKVLKEIA